MGDWRTDEGKRLLEARSPGSHAEKIYKPVLIEQGKVDPRVAESETAALALAVKSHKVPVTYVVYPDEGRGLARAADRLSFGAIAESFLATCLGGPQEPIAGDLADSTFTVPVGAERVPGLRAALRPAQLEPVAAPPAALPAPDGGVVDAGLDGGAILDGGPDSKSEADAGRRNDGGDGGK